jgi:hypothetical protein
VGRGLDRSARTPLDRKDVAGVTVALTTAAWLWGSVGLWLLVLVLVVLAAGLARTGTRETEREEQDENPR